MNKTVKTTKHKQNNFNIIQENSNLKRIVNSEKNPNLKKNVIFEKKSYKI